MSSVTLDTSKLKAYEQKLRANAGKLAGKVAHDIEANAKQRSPVDTGFLRNSITTAQESETIWRVTVGASYGLPVEMGHVTRGGTHVPARPYFIPAVEQARKTLPADAKVFLSP